MKFIDRKRRKFTSEQGRNEGMEEGRDRRKSFQAEGNPCAKKQYCNENSRRCLVNVQEFSMNLDTADEEPDMESRIKKGLK